MKFDYYFAGMMPKFNDDIRIFHHNVLASYHYQKDSVERAVDNMREYRRNGQDILNRLQKGVRVPLGEPNKLFVDSGAFSVWTKGKEINVLEYIDWLNARADSISLFGQVDKIPGKYGVPATSEQVSAAAEQTLENYRFMRERVVNKDGLLYTFHFGEPIKFLECALKEFPDMKYMAFGGLVGRSFSERDAFLETAFRVVRQSPNPAVKVHTFGMTDFDLLRKYPIASADSTGWIMVSANGSIFSDYGNIVVGQKKSSEPDFYKNRFPKGMLSNIEQRVCKKFGFSFEELETDYKNRIYYNCAFMKNKLMTFVQTPQAKKRILFDVKK